MVPWSSVRATWCSCTLSMLFKMLIRYAQEEEDESYRAVARNEEAAVVRVAAIGVILSMA